MTDRELVNPLTQARDDADRLRLLLVFAELEACPHSSILALRPYLDGRPECLFNRVIYRLMIDWLRDRDGRQRAELRKYLAGLDAELSSAMLFLRQINAEEWHDRSLVEGDEYEVVRFIDKALHPAYIRLAEAVLAPLIRPVAHFGRLDRGMGTEGLDVFNSVEELSRGPMAPCVGAYRHTVRNGIGHGGITYLQKSIRYRDKRGNSEILDVWSAIRLCDDMVDACNALASAIKVFLIASLSSGYSLPHELLVEELLEETQSPWWTIGGCIPTELPDATQLLIYARPCSRDVLKIQWAAVHSAALAESLAPGYDRYFFSLAGTRNWTGWAAFDGSRLRALRESGATEVHEFAPALERGGFFYVPRPALPRTLGRLDTLARSLLLQWPLVRQQIRENLQVPTMLARDARMHRNAWGYVLNGAVVMPDLQEQTAAATIRSNKRRILHKAAGMARSCSSPFDAARYLPLGYARVGVYSEDYRRRRLSSFGLGPQLVCTVQLQRIRRIKSPDILGATVEASGNWRIAWNRAWVELGGETGILPTSQDAD